MTDIFSRLEADHNKHRKLLTAIAETSGDSEDRRRLFEEFRVEVTAHANAEEQALYAEMLSMPELQDKGRHSVAEHKELDDLLEELDEMEFSSTGWLTRFKTLAHRYEHHIDEEEEEIFPPAKKALGPAKAKALMAVFEQRKPAEIEKAE